MKWALLALFDLYDFPVSREFGTGDGFDYDCVRRHAWRRLVCSSSSSATIPSRAALRRILRTYARYYNRIRTHRSLDNNAPVSRPVQWTGIINSHTILGGLHHCYVRIYVFGTHIYGVSSCSSEAELKALRR